MRTLKAECVSKVQSDMNESDPNPILLFLVKDNSGIRIFYTDELRKNDGSVLLLGYRHSPFLMIPPKQESFKINGVCDPECFQKVNKFRINMKLVY